MLNKEKILPILTLNSKRKICWYFSLLVWSSNGVWRPRARDGTKTHGIGKKNEINAVFGKDLKTGEKHLLALDVNKS